MNPTIENLVIGSGPSGISAAQALLAQGRSVTLVDVGLTLEGERQALLDEIGSQPFEHWNSRQVEKLKGRMPSDSTGIQVKLLYGSDYPYRDAAEQNQLQIPEGSYKPSFAQGGLTTVWGGSLLPYNERDFERWPVGLNDMAPHYRAVADWLPVAAAEDDLQSLYPIYSKKTNAVRPSRQARFLIKRMSENRERLQGKGIRFGYSREAMRSKECVECGLCLYGCPYRLIYNAADTLQELKAHPDFKYIPNVRVDRLVENPEGVSVQGLRLDQRSPWSIQAGRVFVGAGIISTAKIILESARYYDKTLPMLDSQYTLLPLVTLPSFPDIETERLHTLCQLFLEINNKSLSEHNIHCQLYTYSDLYLHEFKNKAKGILPWLPGSRRHILSRLMISLCYLHSDDSSRLKMLLKNPDDSSENRLQVKFEINPRTRMIEKKLAWMMSRNAFSLGFMPLVPMIHLAHPGRGYHNGGSFPMSQRSEGPQTDRLGRPFGWQRIHLVDASVFPTIPAATITYTVMANAHRIATESIISTIQS